MAFPLMIHLNSTRRALAPNTFLWLLYVEIFVDIIVMALLPLTAAAIARAVVLHPNFRLINLSTIVHYALGVLARFVIIYYEVNDLPVTTSDWVIVTADMIRDQLLGYLISLLGIISFERYVATRWWKWYERRGRGTLCVFFLAECIGNFYPHETNLVVFAVIVLCSGVLFLIAYTDNVRILRSLAAFTTRYTVSKLFQVRENLRALKFTFIFICFMTPIMTLCFVLLSVFFFAPPHWERARYICVALVDLCISIYAPVFFVLPIYVLPEYHRELFKIRWFARLSTLLGLKEPKNVTESYNSSTIDNTRTYFDHLLMAWI